MSTANVHRLVIRRNNSWFDFDLHSLWEYRDLLLLLVRRDFVSKYKQTILGPAWFVVQPVLMTMVFSVIFGRVAKIPTDGLPNNLFYLSGLLCWTYFSQSFTATSDTFIAQAQVFSKVYFPRLIVPISAVLGNLAALGIALVTFLGFFTYYRYFTPVGDLIFTRWQVVFFPLVLLQVAAISLGSGLWMSVLTAKYRDLKHLSAFLIQIWMYGTPIIAPLSLFKENGVLWLVLLNPMTAPTELTKYMFLGTAAPGTEIILVSVAITLFALVTGVMAFKRIERIFIDTV